MGNFSNLGKSHPDWRYPNPKLYGPKLRAIFAIAQRSLLFDDTRGMRGINLTTGLTDALVMELYENMLWENAENPHRLMSKVVYDGVEVLDVKVSIRLR